MALRQNQPLGNDRFYAEIEAMTGQCRVLRKRGRPRKKPEADPSPVAEQRDLPL